MNIQFKNLFVENLSLLSGIYIVPCSIIHPLKLLWIQMQMGGSYTMVQHAGLYVES